MAAHIADYIEAADRVVADTAVADTHSDCTDCMAAVAGIAKGRTVVVDTADIVKNRIAAVADTAAADTIADYIVPVNRMGLDTADRLDTLAVEAVVTVVQVESVGQIGAVEQPDPEPFAI